MKTDENSYPLLDVLEFLALGQYHTAYVKLGELLRMDEFWKSRSNSKQIKRLEEVFAKVSGQRPWPEDFHSEELIKWRGKLGGILCEMPLARLIADVQANGKGKRNLLYFLSTEKGLKSSRWEMLLLNYREQEYQKEKAIHKQQSEDFWKQIDAAPAVPEWVRKLRAFRDAHQRVLDNPRTEPREKAIAKTKIEAMNQKLAEEGY